MGPRARKISDPLYHRGVLGSGDQLGPYVILSRAGVGGMGEVYQARDTRLDRIVAIKVLGTTNGRQDLRDRFQREARAISKLNHPHVCTVHDVGQHNGIDYLVMEYLKGETLEDRLSRSSLTLDEVLRWGTQIANGLDRAHRSGIVHRDLKPSNIMLTSDGTKLLDFGLAKGRIPPASDERTISRPLTTEGTLLGTLPYMAPEQLEGKEADARTDIFALGCVLFEMVTRKKAFSGSSQASLIAAIMHADPPAIAASGVIVPAAFERVVNRCLAKDPEDRWQSARDIALELTSLAERTPEVTARRQRNTLWRWILAGLAATLLVVVALLTRAALDKKQPDAVVQVEIVAPEGAHLTQYGGAISPDGRYVAFVANRDGNDHLWLRPLNARTARILEDTEDAQFPFWSPDSSSIGFFSGAKLKRFDLNGVGTRTLATALFGRGGTWSRDGVILYAPALNSRLWKVSAAGGEPTPVTVLDGARGDARHIFPQFLPDGKHFLFVLGAKDVGRSGTYIGTLEDPSKVEPIPELQGNAFQAVFAPSREGSRGYLIYAKERSLVAQLFDLHTLRVQGEAQPIVSRESFSAAAFPGFLNVSASLTGTLLDGGASQRARNVLVWRARDGRLLEVAGHENDYISPAISPDGSRIAVTKADPDSGDYDIWIENLKVKSLSRFTFHHGLDVYPVWNPDGASIVFTSDAAGLPTLFRKPVTGSAEPEQLFPFTEANQYGYDISADGKYLIFAQIGEHDRGDLWALRLGSQEPPFPWLKTSAEELHAQFSPGAQAGRWVVYTSDESGIEQVYVRAFRGKPSSEAKWQVSVNGGRFARWRGDGSEIVYLAADGKLMSVAIRFGSDSVDVGPPRLLFDPQLPQVPFARYPYDLTRDGQRFLCVSAGRQPPAGSLNMIQNWTNLLNR